MSLRCMYYGFSEPIFVGLTLLALIKTCFLIQHQKVLLATCTCQNRITNGYSLQSFSASVSSDFMANAVIIITHSLTVTFSLQFQGFLIIINYQIDLLSFTQQMDINTMVQIMIKTICDVLYCESCCNVGIKSKRRKLCQLMEFLAFLFC